MAASIKRQVERELARLMKERGTKPKDKIEAARLYWEMTGRRATVVPPPAPDTAPVKSEEPSSLD
jgi:hypothetical protein